MARGLLSIFFFHAATSLASGLVPARRPRMGFLLPSFRKTTTTKSKTIESYCRNNEINDDDLTTALHEYYDNGSNHESRISWKGNDIVGAMKALATADAVCLDVDSTVIEEEGIDVLAGFLGKGKEVAQLTKTSMEGSLKFQDANEMSLDLLQPTRQSIEQCLQERPFSYTRGLPEFVTSLQNADIDVYLVSGGFRIMIEPIAEQLGIDKTTNLIANTLWFDDDGKYIGFDPNEPTSADMGKPKALQGIKSERNFETIVMIGDGATDAQAKPPANAFIGFGGMVVRDAVVQKADWFVTEFDDLRHIIETFRKQ